MSSRYLTAAKLAATEASHILLKYYEDLPSVESKGSKNDLVTIADKQAEQAIKGVLLDTFPDHTMLGEEGATPDPDKEFCWVVDPLDGTVNYVHGIPFFAVSIALQRGDEFITGVVCNPIIGEWFTAEKGGGAFLNGQPITVSDETDLSQAMCATGFPYRLNEQEIDPRPLFARFLGETRAIRRLGSAALDLCYVAMGRFGGYWEATLSPWDLAAGTLIVEEAGGKVTDLLGGPLDLEVCRILATNGKLHEPMLAILREHLKP